MPSSLPGRLEKVIWNSTDHYLKNQNKNFCFSILCFKKTNSKWISIYSPFELPNFRLKTQWCGWFQSYDFSLPLKIPIIPTADDVPRSQPKTVLPGGRVNLDFKRWKWSNKGKKLTTQKVPEINICQIFQPHTILQSRICNPHKNPLIFPSLGIHSTPYPLT